MCFETSNIFKYMYCNGYQSYQSMKLCTREMRVQEIGTKVCNAVSLCIFCEKSVDFLKVHRNLQNLDVRNYEFWSSLIISNVKKHLLSIEKKLHLILQTHFVSKVKDIQLHLYFYVIYCTSCFLFYMIFYSMY